MSTIDLDFRPRTYFRPRKVEEYLLSKVKGAAVKRQLQELFDAGLYDEMRPLLGEKGIPEELRMGLEATHPMYMGGNYLPDAAEDEVVIASIWIASTTGDVTAAYARSDGKKIHYRVVDEYEGETLEGPAEMVSEKPLTLRELTDFFLDAWRLPVTVEHNYPDDLERGLGFFRAESEFYSQFDDLCRVRVIEHYDRA